MTDIVWRRWLLSLCAGGAVLTAACLWMVAAFPGRPAGVSITPTGTPFFDRLDIAQGSPAANRGLRSGDIADLSRLSPSERFRWREGWIFGQRIEVPLLRANAVRVVTIAADERVPVRGGLLFAIAGFFWMLSFAALLAWRCRGNAEARVLAPMLALYSLGGLLLSAWISPWPLADAVAFATGNVLVDAAFALFATYALLFARPVSLLRRVLAWLSYAGAGATALYAIAGLIGLWTGAADPAGPAFSGPAALLLQSSMPALFPLFCVGFTVTAARGAERERIIWATASLGPLFLVQTFLWGAAAFDPALRSLSLLGTDVAIFVAPIGLTYSLLNRRLLDVGFAVNRIAVFSVISIVIVGAFILMEWLLGGWFERVGHTANVAVSAALAIALGFSVNAIHRRVDHFVDSVFFRKRYEAERAIRTAAREAPYITDRGTLLERTATVLAVYADVSSVDMLLDDDAGRYGSVSENDPAIVALRARHEVLDLRTVGSALHGEFVYPMVARGHLVGAMVLGPKRSGESYAPDESDAIAQLAHGVAATLDVLAAKRAGSRDGVLEAIRELRTEMRGLREDVQRLYG